MPKNAPILHQKIKNINSTITDFKSDIAKKK